MRYEQALLIARVVAATITGAILASVLLLVSLALLWAVNTLFNAGYGYTWSNCGVMAITLLTIGWLARCMKGSK